MRLCKLYTAIAAVSLLSTSLLHAAISPECSKYNELSEHYKTCKAYDQSKVKVLSGIKDLTTEVNSAKEGELLIIPAKDKDNPYLLTGPLVLKKGMGLLSTGKGSQGFFHIAPGIHFSIGENTVYDLVEMAEGSTVTGLGIDARKFSAAAIKTLKNLTVPKTLVHAEGIRQFTLTWASLFGRRGFQSTLWADNENSNSAGQGMLNIKRSWLESNGADNVAVIAGGRTSESIQTVSLKHLMAITSGTTTSTDLQHGLWLKAVRGEIEHNYLFLATTTGNQKRIILVLDGLTNPEKGSRPTVAENYFYSPNEHLSKSDSAFQFLQSAGKDLEVHVFANGITNNMQIATDNSPDAGKFVQRQENYRMHPLEITPNWKMFFDETNDITIFPRGGTCLTPLFAVTDLNRTLMDTGNNAWSELCGQGIKDPDFALAYDYEGDNYSYLTARINQLTNLVDLYRYLMIAGWGTAFIEAVIIGSSAIYSYRKGKGFNPFTFRRFDTVETE